MDIFNQFTEAQTKITACASMEPSDTCKNANAAFDFGFKPFISINIWWTSVMNLLNFALEAGISYGANYLEYYQAKALNSLYCAGTNNLQVFINLVEAAWYIFSQVNAQGILVEQVFYYTYPIMCTCQEATAVMSEDMIKQVLGDPTYNWSFLGVCQDTTTS